MKMASNTVSIYIDDTRVRVMVTRGRRITRLAGLPLESALAEVDSKEKEIELGRKIQRLLKTNKISARKIILGVSGLHCLTRPIALPELPKAMLNEAVLREARRILPMPLEQLYLSWQVISVAGGKTNIFLVALPRQMADMIIRVIGYAGCKPYLMDIKPLALARLSPEPTAIILDVQSNEFDIVMMVNGVPQPVRTIAFPQDGQSFSDKFITIKEELKRTLEFVRAKVEEKQLEADSAIYVSGELAEHPELYEPMAAEFKLKPARLAGPLKYPRNLEPAPYLVNIGLALKEMAREARPLKPNFNTLPAPYQPRKISFHKLMVLPAAACAVGLLVLMTFAVQDAAGNIRNMETRLKTTNSLILKKQTQKADIAATLSSLEQQKIQTEAEYETYSTAFKKLMSTGRDMNTDLDASVETINSGVELASLSINDAQVSISGAADGEESVFKYVRSLTNTGRFQEITITGIAKNETVSVDENGVETTEIFYSFSLSCMIKAGL
jgi:type IV pilus assembly protein PilM